MNELVKAVIGLCEKCGPSPLRGPKARAVVKSFLKKSGRSAEDVRSLFRDLDRAAGPFASLPESFRRSMAAAAEFHIRERNLLSHSLARFLAYGPLSKAGGHVVHLGWKLKEGRLHSLLLTRGRRIQREGRRLARVFIRMSRYTSVYRSPFLHILWEYIKFDPWPLIQNYIQGIPVDPRISPVFKIAGRSVASCGLVGIDLLPSKGKLYFLESNFNPGHNLGRHLLTPEGDSVCRYMADWAVERGYSKIVFFPFSFQGVFDKALENAWRHIILKKGIRLEIVDDPMIGSPWPRSRKTLMDLDADGTLFVNGRYLSGPLAHLIAEKGLLDEEIRRFNAGAPREDRIPIPRRIAVHEDVPSLDEEGIFPNLIVKNARLDQTKGISLYRSKRLPEGVNTPPYITYEYIVPDLVVKEDQRVVKKFVYDFRAYLLVTPEGPVYLGAKKGISSAAVPGPLPLGKVADKSPYISNLYAGAYHRAPSKEEDQLCRSAVLAVGAVIDRFLRNKYALIPN